MQITLKGYFPIAFFLLLSLNLSSQSTLFQSGTSIRNGQQGHFYKMVSWDDSQYQEFAYSERNANGAVSKFMNWRVIFPPGYNPNDNSKKYPMIVMLHGAGESGRKWTDHYEYLTTDPEYDNNGHHLLLGGKQHLDAVNRPLGNARAFPGIVIFPQVSYNGAWDTENKRMAILIIEEMIKNHQADPFRVYLHGLSNGAKGTWSLSTDRPDLIAAILPMSGVGTDLEAMTDSLVTMPLWLFQGGLDTNPSPGAANQWINKLVDKGGRPRFSYYPNLDHGTWNTAYGENDFFAWMIGKSKREIYVFGDHTVRTASAEQPVPMGFSAGFTNYQWTRNGANIPGGTARYYTATQEGVYTVKFRQPINGTWAESYPINLTPETHPGDLVYIPDFNFKSILITNSAINTNGDTEIQYAEAEAFTGQIKANGQNIASMVGLEAFTALTDLRVLNNQLTVLDVSANTELRQLHIQQNHLTSLNLSANTKLTHLRVFDNDLTVLNVQNGNNQNISLFEADQNDLTCIQVDNVAYAQANFTSVDPGVTFSLNCGGGSSEPVVTIPDANFKNALLANASINSNGDTEIQVNEAEVVLEMHVETHEIADLTGINAFTALTHLYLNENNLATLDVSENVNLQELHVQNNQLNTLLFPPGLNTLDATSNQLPTFDISGTAVSHLLLSNNALTFLNLQTGTVIEEFFALNNPDLECIQVDDVGYAEANWTDHVDETVEFSSNCAGVPEGVVYIPDVGFKAALLATPSINTNGDAEIQTTEASAFTGMINVNSRTISSIEGIAAFTELTDLRVHNNLITTLDVSANTKLIQLHFQKNQVATLDISANTALRYFRGFNNALTSLNIQNGNNHNFVLFEATGNSLTCIQVDNVAYATANFTSQVDPGASFSVNCSGGEPIVSIPDANFKSVLLEDSTINVNGDTEIQVSEADTVTTINVVSKNIADMTGISAFSALTQLYAGNNQLTTIDVRDNSNLTTLEVPNNQLTQIQFGNNLGTLDATANQLTSLDLSGTSITRLIIGNNLLTSLNLKTGAFFEDLYAIGNPELTCIEVDDVAYAETNWTDDVDAGVEFDLECTGGGPGVVNIPDPIFKAALVGNVAINTNGDTEIQLTEASAYTGMINVGSMGISSVVGVEAFTGLTDLRVLNNQLTALDVSANTQLTQLHCQKNNLASLDISANTKINKFRVFLNDLTELNMQNGNNHNFQLFDARDNNLTCIEVDDVAYADANFTSVVDPGVSFSADCSSGSVTVAQTNISDVRIFPNPFPRKVHVTWSGPIEAGDALRLFELTNGREISPLDYRINGNKVTLDMAHQASGQYVLQLGNKTYRIIKR